MNDTWYRAVISVVPEEAVKCDELMSGHTTFRIGGPADIYCEPTADEVASLIKACQAVDAPVTVIGNGSNLLVGDKGIRGVVIAIGRRMSSIFVNGTRIHAEAGALLGRMAQEALKASLTGMEFAAGIPGSVGGAVVMNAGAYGGEICQMLESAQVLERDQTLRTYRVNELDLSYRHSRIMESGGIVLSADFVLQPGDPEAIRSQMEDLKTRRSDKQPLNYPSAGSTFKRPAGYFAGKLIDDAGLRGYRVGDAQVSEKHCGFVINRGHATASEVRQLMEDVQRIVKENSGVTIEPEVRMIGEF